MRRTVVAVVTLFTLTNLAYAERGARSGQSVRRSVPQRWRSNELERKAAADEFFENMGSGTDYYSADLRASRARAEMTRAAREAVRGNDMVEKREFEVLANTTPAGDLIGFAGLDEPSPAYPQLMRAPENAGFFPRSDNGVRRIGPVCVFPDATWQTGKCPPDMPTMGHYFEAKISDELVEQMKSYLKTRDAVERVDNVIREQAQADAAAVSQAAFLQEMRDSAAASRADEAVKRVEEVVSDQTSQDQIEAETEALIEEINDVSQPPAESPPLP